MNANFERIDAVNGKITVDIKREDFASDVKKRVAEMGKTHPIKGFRPGHAPASLLNKYYGPGVTARVVDNKVNDALIDCIKANDLNVLGEPMLEEGTNVDLMDASKDEFTFNFEVGMAPEITLKLNKRIQVPFYLIEVSDQMVNDAIEHDRKRLGKLVDGEKSDMESMLRGSMAELDEQGNVKEDGVKVERTVISPRYVADKEEAARFEGLKVGDTVKFNPHKAYEGNVAELSSMLNVDRDVAAEMKSDFNFTVEEIKVNELAEMNQEFFDGVLGKDVAHNEEELREGVRKAIAQMELPESNHRFTVDAQRVLLRSAGDLELPEALLTRLVNRNRAEENKPELTEDEKKSMFKSLRWQLIRDHFIREMGITASEDDVHNTAMAIAQQQMTQYGMYNLPKEYLENYANRILEDPKNHQMCYDTALDQKFFAMLKETVKVNEKTVTSEEFGKLYENDEKAD